MEQSGRVTMPIQEGMDEELVKLIALWKADAVRNSDGTQLSDALLKYVKKVYKTFFPVRQDQEYAKAHPEQLQETYIASRQNLAVNSELEINLLDGYFSEQLKVDTIHDPKKWWEVINRTTSTVIPTESWECDCSKGTVIIKDAKPFNSYTVTFLAYQIWDPTQMYNHITNNWGDVPHSLPYNPAIKETHHRMIEFYEQWLKENEDINVVRFTTFFYHFTLFFNNVAKEKFVEWFGYSQSISPEMLEAFEKEKGYRLRPEDLVDEGYNNTAFRVPKKAYLDYIDFVQQFVSRTAKELVDLTHKYGKEAMMFLGDNYIGTEPYGKYFGNIGIDAVVGSVGSGATMRMIADIPHVKYTEGRFLPYFFPDVFKEGGDPVGEANLNWLQARRAMMRNSVDRIGYGGYPELALKFPDFIDRIKDICDEFRELYTNINKTKAYTAPFKVAILNCWGSLRTWQTHMVAHALLFKQTYSYIGVIEALSGMSVDVSFISFDDIKNNGISDDIGVIINVGNAYTAFSGAENWIDHKVILKIKSWIYNGGGFIGVGEPSAYQHQGRFFQLADVLGVEKETDFTLSFTKYNKLTDKKHFITDDNFEDFDFGNYIDSVYKSSDEAENLIIKDGCTMLAANQFGKGRGVYISGLPYSAQNTRLLLRSIYWAKSDEKGMANWYTDNVNTECSAYTETKRYAVLNNTTLPQVTNLYTGTGEKFEISLAPMEIKWFDM